MNSPHRLLRAEQRLHLFNEITEKKILELNV